MATAVTYTIENFRSIRKMDFEIRPLTILYGPNGVGKSSLMYAPLFLKHVLMTPAQPFDQIFTMPLFSLGSFDQVVFRHTRGEKIVVSVKVKGPENQNTDCRLNQQSVFSSLKWTILTQG